MLLMYNLISARLTKTNTPNSNDAFSSKMSQNSNDYPSFAKNEKPVPSPCPLHPVIFVEEGMCLFCGNFPVLLCYHLNYTGCDQCNPPEELGERRKMLEALVHHLQLPNVELPEKCTKTKFPFCEKCLGWVEELGKIPFQNRDENEEQQVETLRNNIYQKVKERSNLKLGCDKERGLNEMEKRNQVFTKLRDTINIEIGFKEVHTVSPDPDVDTNSNPSVASNSSSPVASPVASNSNPPVASNSNPPVASNSNPPVASPVASNSNPPVASPVASNSSNPPVTSPVAPKNNLEPPASSSQPSTSSCTPPQVNSEGMCLLCPNPVSSASPDIVVRQQQQKKLLENVCQHFQLKKLMFPKGLIRSRFPICGRCQIWIRQLGSFPPNQNQPNFDKKLQKRIDKLKTNIYNQVVERQGVRTTKGDEMTAQWNKWEKTHHVFIRLPEAIRKAYEAKMDAICKRKNEETLRKQNGGGSSSSQPPGSTSSPFPLNIKGMCLFCPNEVPPVSQNTEDEPLENMKERAKLLESVIHHFKIISIELPQPQHCSRSRFPMCGRCWGWIKELGSVPLHLEKKAGILKNRIYAQLWDRLMYRTSWVAKMKTKWEPVEKSQDVFTELADEILKAHADKESLATFEKLYDRYNEKVQKLFPTGGGSSQRKKPTRRFRKNKVEVIDLS